MATSKEYAYFVKGNKFAIVEKDFTFSSGLNYVPDGSNDLDDIGGVGSILWKSPIETIDDGIEIEYVYSPEWIYTNSSTGVTINGFESDSGYLKLTADSGLTDIPYIVIRNSEKWNGLHKIRTYTSATAITLETRYAGGSVSDSDSTADIFTVKQDIIALTDEDFDLDITRYQANAVVNYVKARYAEDTGQVDLKEYFMREFRRMVEKHASGKKIGPYRAQGYNLFK